MGAGARPGEAGRHVVGAIDANHAVISTADGLGVLATDGTLKGASFPACGTGDWTYIGFTNPTHGSRADGQRRPAALDRRRPYLEGRDLRR